MKKVFILAAATIILAACDQNDENQDTSPVAAQITATIGESTVTRASNTSWAKGDAIGISSTVGELAGPYVNVRYATENGDGKFTGTSLFFYKPMTLTAYYPFTGAEGTAPGSITASTSAGNQTAEDQPKIDFLWDSKTGITASDPKVNFTFTHQMSKVTFTFISSDPVVQNGVTISKGVDVSTIVRYEIDGLVLDGTFNPATGVCAAKTDVAAAKLTMSYGKEQAVDKKRLMPSLILFPYNPQNEMFRRIKTKRSTQ